MEAVHVYGIQERKEEISKWLNLPYFIAELEEELENFSSNYYREHSFYSHTVYTEHFGIVTEAPRVEDVAINLADSCMVLSDRIKRNKADYRRFKQLLTYLPINDLHALDDERTNTVYDGIQFIKKISATKHRGIRFKLEIEFKKRMENIK